MPTVTDLIDSFESEAARDRPDDETPDVGVIMGSDSDLDVMAGAHDALTDLGFTEVTDYDDAPSGYSFESWVVSAHRTPDLMYAYAETAAERGLDVIIAGAGGKSADLPNMTASLAYPIPVVGVPVQEKSVDSVIGMPTGAPLTAVDAGSPTTPASRRPRCSPPTTRTSLTAFATSTPNAGTASPPSRSRCTSVAPRISGRRGTDRQGRRTRIGEPPSYARNRPSTAAKA